MGLVFDTEILLVKMDQKNCEYFPIIKIEVLIINHFKKISRVAVKDFANPDAFLSKRYTLGNPAGF